MTNANLPYDQLGIRPYIGQLLILVKQLEPGCLGEGSYDPLGVRP
jgi:hypothetical protein